MFHVGADGLFDKSLSFDVALATEGERRVVVDLDAPEIYCPIEIGRRMDKQARIAFPYVKKGYDAFYEMIGMHTNYKLVVYASPRWSPHCWGGTATGATLIPYGYNLLDLDSQEEWKRHRVPRLIGLFEEMGHDFTLGLGTRFGGEAIGMYLSGKVTMEVTEMLILAIEGSTIDCFGRLPGLNFRQMLRDLRISDKTSWYSLRPSHPDWDRRFIPPDERKPGDYPAD